MLPGPSTEMNDNEVHVRVEGGDADDEKLQGARALDLLPKHSADGDTTASGSSTVQVQVGAAAATAQGAQEEAGAVGLFQLFRFCSTFDTLVLVIGTVCAVAAGGVMAAFAILLGRVINRASARPADSPRRR